MERLSARWSPDELLIYSKYHLGYEIGMFLTCGLTLQGEGAQQLPPKQRNLFIEGFGIHLRGLLEFFCRENSTQGVHADDVLATDYMGDVLWARPQVSQAIREAWNRVNKEVGHLTALRKGDADPTKDWGNLIATILPEMMQIFRDFLHAADPRKLAPEIRNLVSDLEMKTAGVVSDCCTSTTTAFTFHWLTGIAPCRFSGNQSSY